MLTPEVKVFETDLIVVGRLLAFYLHATRLMSTFLFIAMTVSFQHVVCLGKCTV